MTKEQFISVIERLATWSIMYAVGRGWIPLNMQGETLGIVVGIASLLYGLAKNSRFGKVKAVERMPEVSAIVMNARGSDIANSSATGPKVLNGEASRKIMEIVEIPPKDQPKP